ncbi:RNA 2',3'-cyclic phosphodiesterase [Neptuniibacter sp. CAU 1671]|uniref:RNA 2',3'-cyclic phosphodiesterase n=1 Tax=Neptuniibacter sp. CAU 1671 TaxID=3032593 RepID=UPI0023D9DE71|nr:RNA 2',3'-cyclic phosphodiesterase [Neptuniibacter sp. CAU 1671]MDF2182959.1 RNA 2',3'-cyclic phosphodiesterase [Neptuniibacter sp. CAU 1671]
MRIFTAIDLPEALLDELSLRLPTELSDTVRWAPLDQLHLTLVFIGEVSPHRLDPLLEAIAEVEFSPVSIHCREVGSFSSGILWLGVEPSEALLRLQQKLHRIIHGQGFQLPRRRYRPHITLARGKAVDAGTMAVLANRMAGFEFSFETDAFCLKSSQLRQEGAVYTTEAIFMADETAPELNPRRRQVR